MFPDSPCVSPTVTCRAPNSSGFHCGHSAQSLQEASSAPALGHEVELTASRAVLVSPQQGPWASEALSLGERAQAGLGTQHSTHILHRLLEVTQGKWFQGHLSPALNCKPRPGRRCL